MSKPRNDLNNTRYLKETYIFFEQIAAVCKDTEDCRTFLKELLTPSELRMIKKRWYIARLLQTGMDVRSVASEAEVSTTTVVRVSQTLKKEGCLFKQILNNLAENKSDTDNNSDTNSHRYAFGQEEGESVIEPTTAPDQAEADPTEIVD